MQGGNVLALHLWNPQLPDHGVDKQPHRTAVLFPGARLAMDRDIFLQEPAPEISHARLGLASGVCIAWIDASLRTSQYLQRTGTRLIRVQRSVRADGEPAQFPGDAGLDDVALASRAPNTQAKSGEFSVPIDGVRPTGLYGIDGALGDTGDAVCHGIAP